VHTCLVIFAIPPRVLRAPRYFSCSSYIDTSVWDHVESNWISTAVGVSFWEAEFIIVIRVSRGVGRDALDTRPDCGLSARRIQRRWQRTPHDPEGGGQGAKMAVLKQPFPIGDFGQDVAFIDNMI